MRRTTRIAALLRVFPAGAGATPATVALEWLRCEQDPSVVARMQVRGDDRVLNWLGKQLRGRPRLRIDGLSKAWEQAVTRQRTHNGKEEESYGSRPNRPAT